MYKVGPDCGRFTVAVDGGPPLVAVDAYDPAVNWGAVVTVAGGLDPGAAHALTVAASGTADPASSGAYAQLMGVLAYGA